MSILAWIVIIFYLLLPLLVLYIQLYRVCY